MINLLREAGHTGLIIQITGEPGKGKTKMALGTGAEYGETALINADTKRALVNQLLSAGAEFGYYRDAVEKTLGMKEIDRHMQYLKWFDEIEALPPERRRVIIIDPWEYFEITLKPMVENNPKRFSDYWSTMGTFKGAQQWQMSHLYAAHIFTRLSGLCDMLILTSHLRNAYKGSVRIPGKFKPDNKVAVEQKVDLRIWLRENPKSPVPVALMMKRGLMRAVMVDGKVKLVNVLPKRLEPQRGDEEVWDVIRRYWNDPMGSRPPLAHEIPDEFELSILEGTLTEDQQHAWELEAKMQEELEAELEGTERQEQVEKAKAVYEETGSYAAVKEALGVTLPEAIKLVKGE